MYFPASLSKKILQSFIIDETKQKNTSEIIFFLQADFKLVRFLNQCSVNRMLTLTRKPFVQAQQISD